MTLLHEITVGNPIAYIWATIHGGNGQIVGNRTNPKHIVPLERNTPPPLDPRADGTWMNGYGRRYWTPWSHPIGGADQAICRAIRTRGRPQNQYIQVSSWGWNPDPGAPPPGACPDCLTAAVRMGVTPKMKQDVDNQDPWYRIPQANRMTAVDPVTGI